MCVGIPMRVVEAEEFAAVCEGRGRRERLDVQLVGAQPVGAWVLAFQGSAVRTLSAEEAAQTDAALDALDAVLAGDGDIDAHFADLVGREPQLPDHLKRSR
ncbi:MAG: HypC/HybG/HupF family hydrogenase formation chaperone [Betaproteobacteria bacterium]